MKKIKILNKNQLLIKIISLSTFLTTFLTTGNAGLATALVV